MEIVKINSYLFNKYWPNAQVVYLGFSPPKFEFFNVNHSFYSLASKQEGGAQCWTRYLHNFFKDIQDEIVLFLIDDYLLCKQPSLRQLDLALKFIKNNKNIGRFDLTFDSQVEGGYLKLNAKLSQDSTIIVKKPDAEYRISTQPALWKREYLLRFLDHDWTPWEFELKGTNLANKNNFKEQTFAFYDQKMCNYPLSTIAKGAVSRLNPGKFNVLGLDFETIDELVDAKLIDKGSLMWGQHADNPPSFEEAGGYDFHPRNLKPHLSSKTNFEEYVCMYSKETDFLTLNLWDNLFTHTKDHPTFGYITPQGEYAPRTSKLRYVEKEKIFDYGSGITIFTDNFLNKDLIESVRSNIKIGWIMEPPVIHSRAYDNAIECRDSLDYVLTFSKELSEKYENFILFPWCYLRVAQDDWGIGEKNKLVSLIASNKRYTEGHKLRHMIADKESEKYGIDLYGSAFKQFSELGKGIAIKDYMYTIVIQNSQVDTFFTDFVDPLITGTVPIFWGTSEISKYFNPNGFIEFNTLEELKIILDNISEKDYNSRMEAIKENYELAKTYWRVDDQLSEKLILLLNE
tara:strand:- start:3155 stop:4867 length:1713 start_codon:yes stop_codon:yes gene_type:complete